MITEIKGCDLPLEAIMAMIYVKQQGFNQFYEVSVGTRISGRGHQVATLGSVSEISKSKFYSQDKSKRFVLPIVKSGHEIHEIGNADFFGRI